MTAARRSNLVTAAIFFAALLVFSLLFARLAGAGVDAGDLAVTDAGVDRVVLADHAAPDAGPYRTPGLVDTRVAADNPDPGAADMTNAEPTAIKVPAPSSDPGGLLGVTKDARKLGGLWLMVIVAAFAVAAEVRKRTAPKDGETPPDPRSWRARSYALACAAAVLLATLIDIKAGGAGWVALAMPGAFAVGRVMDAIDPPKGSKSKATTAGA